jgi:hypothetical protein
MSRRSLTLRVASLPFVAALLVLAVFVGVQWQHIGRAHASTAQNGASPRSGDDWTHAQQVVVALKAKPPKVPVVYLLGGSAARECTISDASWAAQVKRLGGKSVRTYDIGSSDQTYAQDLSPLVAGMPDVTAGSIVLIGINLGRYTSGPPKPATGSGEASTRAYVQHHYSIKHILTVAQKKAWVQHWLSARYPLFKKHFDYNATVLERLIRACQLKGLHPVLLELPRNEQIIGHAFDKPRAKYTANCRKLAKDYGIPYVDFVAKAHLVNGDFYDVNHLVEPGRVKWQKRLSQQVVKLLKQYSMAGN